MSDVLALDGIEKGYLRGTPAEVMVLRGASLAVARGEVVALVAPSGAGRWGSSISSTTCFPSSPRWKT